MCSCAWALHLCLFLGSTMLAFPHAPCTKFPPFARVYADAACCAPLRMGTCASSEMLFPSRELRIPKTALPFLLGEVCCYGRKKRCSKESHRAHDRIERLVDLTAIARLAAPHVAHLAKRARSNPRIELLKIGYERKKISTRWKRKKTGTRTDCVKLFFIEKFIKVDSKFAKMSDN